MNVDTSELKNKIVDSLSIELQAQPTFNSDLLAVKVENAINEVMAKRNYEAAGKSDEWITADIKKYFVIIRNIALFDFAQIGAPFETGHNENSVNRTWVDRNKLFAGVRPFARVF